MVRRFRKVQELHDDVLSNGVWFAWSTLLWRYNETQLRLCYRKIYIYLRDQASVGPMETLKYTVTGFHFLFKIWILDTFPEALKYAYHTANEFPRMRAWRIETQLTVEPLSELDFGRSGVSTDAIDPPKQRSASPQYCQFQEADYIISPSHGRGVEHNTSQGSKIDKLTGVINHLITTKIEKWENERQFGVNDFDNMDGHDETFFGGLEKESPATYVELPPVAQ
ncbi:unnamed protein product [Lactuca saligna]|uniref:Uncharacterized protein n=1 Tax=Lactuca saligna TaxID=75948 RepID=A0AA35Z4K6_LACSI|nr:unnamed protein product [Lactuca saligna]